MDSIVSAVAKFAAEKPDTVAVIANDEKITYATLWKEVQGLAAYINSMIVKDAEGNAKFIAAAKALYAFSEAAEAYSNK